MPRSSDVYALPPNYLATTGEIATAAQHNSPLEDIRDDLNAARPIVAGGTGATVASDARDNLGLTIGTDVQAYDVNLAQLAGLTITGDKLPYGSGNDELSLADFTDIGRTLVGAANDTIAYDAISPLSADGDLVYFDGDNNVALAIGTAGQVLTVNSGNDAPEWADNPGPINLQATQATTSGTSIDKTGIPADVARVTVRLDAVSTNGTSPLLVQIGDSGGIEAVTYDSGASQIGGGAVATGTSTSGFLLSQTHAAADSVSGVITIEKMTLDDWVASWVGWNGSTSNYVGAGNKTLSGVLDRIRLTTVGGSDTFDAGQITVSWEFSA